MPIDNVATILAQVLSGEIDQDQIAQIISFLHAGIDISSLML